MRPTATFAGNIDAGNASKLYARESRWVGSFNMANYVEADLTRATLIGSFVEAVFIDAATKGMDVARAIMTGAQTAIMDMGTATQGIQRQSKRREAFAGQVLTTGAPEVDGLG